MKDEITRVLTMVQEGKIDADKDQNWLRYYKEKKKQQINFWKNRLNI